GGMRRSRCGTPRPENHRRHQSRTRPHDRSRPRRDTNAQRPRSMIDPVKRNRRSTLKQDAFNLPNLLTMARVAIIPLVLWLLNEGTPKACVWAALVYSAAALTDLLDGYLARRMNIVSVLGKFLDPLAAK